VGEVGSQFKKAQRTHALAQPAGADYPRESTSTPEKIRVGPHGSGEQGPDAGSRAQPPAAGASAVATLKALGVQGILGQLARDGQIVDVRCEMPQCYCHRGRGSFDPVSATTDWSPTADHYPRLKMHGGHLTPDNARLAHRLCNRRDYEWRTRINVMLRKGMSLAEIAADLNAHAVPTIHGTNRGTAASVRKAFVS
jgi:hypothetical protein